MSAAKPHPNDTHPNSEALGRAMDAGPASVRAVIALDPKVLAYALDSHSFGARPVYPLRAALKKYYTAGKVVLEALREHEKIIREEFKRRGAEKDLLYGNLLYALSTDASGQKLPHEDYPNDGFKIPMLYHHGYDFTLHTPRSKPLLFDFTVMLIIFLGDGKTVSEFLDRFETEDLSSLNRPYEGGSKSSPMMCSVPLTAYNYFLQESTAVSGHAQRKPWENLLAMAQKGIDLRRVMEHATAEGTCGREVQDYLHKAEMNARAANKDEGLSLRLSCAAGMLPAVLSEIAGRGDEAKITHVLEEIGNYWREEHRHSIRRAQAVVVRKGPVEGSALGAWARGAV